MAANSDERANSLPGPDDISPAWRNAGLIGLPGIRRSGGYVLEEFLRDLSGTKGMRVYREMKDNCPIMGTALLLIGCLLRNVEWRWEADSDKPEDGEAKEFLAEEFSNMEDPWSGICDQVMEMFPFGYALAEIAYTKRKSGKIGWDRWSFIAQESLLEWIFDDRDQAVAFVQLPPSNYVRRVVPMAKCLHFRTTRAKNNPQGRSLFRNAYTSWYYRNRLQEIEAIGIERDLAGMPMMRIPLRFMSPDASADEKAWYEQAQLSLRNIRRDEHEGIIIPSDLNKDGKPLVDLELLSTGGSRQMKPSETIDRYDARLAMVMLADFILLGHEKVGTFSLSSDKTDLFAIALGTYLKDIAGVINKQGADKLLRLNGMPGKAKLVPGDLEKGEISSLFQALQQAVASGVIQPDPNLEGWARELLGAPKPDEDFLHVDGGMLNAAGPGAAGAPPAAAGAKPPAPAGPGGGRPGPGQPVPPVGAGKAPNNPGILPPSGGAGVGAPPRPGLGPVLGNLAPVRVGGKGNAAGPNARPRAAA